MMKQITASIFFGLALMIIAGRAAATRKIIPFADTIGTRAFTIRLGDTVTWQFVSNAERLQSISGPTGYMPWDTLMDGSMVSSFTYVPTVAGTYTYGCGNRWHYMRHGVSEMRVEAASSCAAGRFDIDIYYDPCVCGPFTNYTVSSNLSGNKYYWRQDPGLTFNPYLTFTSNADSSQVRISPSVASINAAGILFTATNASTGCSKNFSFNLLNTTHSINIKDTQVSKGTFHFGIVSSPFSDSLIVWDYGDGMQDTVLSSDPNAYWRPHIYPGGGNYNLSVTKLMKYSWRHCVRQEAKMITAAGSGAVVTSAGQYGKAYMIYPDPAGRELHVVLVKNGGDAMLDIYDVSGKHVMGVNRGAYQEAVVSLAELPEGIYTLRVSQSSVVWTGRFTVKH